MIVIKEYILLTENAKYLGVKIHKNFAGKLC